MRISDWSSDVCSSDLIEILPGEISRLDHPGRRPASWLPWDYATEPPVRADPAELAGIVRNCVRAWSGRFRSEARSVGKECDSTGRSRGSTYHQKKNKKKFTQHISQ